MISEYAARLAGKLSFDRTLSHRVRQEVEDHLREAVAADSSGEPLEAERRAIANFGDPHAIAAQFAAASLAAQTRKIGVTAILVIAGVFLAMTTRVTWYDLTQWGVCEDLLALSETLGLIDRSAFLIAAIGGIASWVHIKQLRRFLVLCTIATGALVACVVCDGALTAQRLSGWEFSVDFLIPIFSMAIEIGCAAVLVFHIRGVTRRMASATSLMRI